MRADAYSARFYVVAMLFVIFDVETMFLFPWAILYRSWVTQHMGAFCVGVHVRVFGDTAGWLRVAVQEGRVRLGVILRHGYCSRHSFLANLSVSCSHALTVLTACVRNL